MGLQRSFPRIVDGPFTKTTIGLLKTLGSSCGFLISGNRKNTTLFCFECFRLLLEAQKLTVLLPKEPNDLQCQGGLSKCLHHTDDWG